jgi:hypothetical protein
MGGPVDDDMANLIVAQLLYLDSADQQKDITMYVNSPGGSVTAGAKGRGWRLGMVLGGWPAKQLHITGRGGSPISVVCLWKGRQQAATPGFSLAVSEVWGTFGSQCTQRQYFDFLFPLAWCTAGMNSLYIHVQMLLCKTRLAAAGVRQVQPPLCALGLWLSNSLTADSL